jgi:hypothetical protein
LQRCLDPPAACAPELFEGLLVRSIIRCNQADVRQFAALRHGSANRRIACSELNDCGAVAATQHVQHFDYYPVRIPQKRRRAGDAHSFPNGQAQGPWKARQVEKFGEEKGHAPQ